MALEEWLDKHEGLKSKIQIKGSQLASEFGACALFGVDPADYFQRERSMRKAMTGYFIGKNALDAMRSHDTRPKPNPKNKPRKGGKR